MATVPVSNMATTWTNGATTYTAVKMNVTDTASASASLLMDLQVGAATKFSVSKAGAAIGLTFASTSGGSSAAPAFNFLSALNYGLYYGTGDATSVGNGPAYSGPGGISSILGSASFCQKAAAGVCWSSTASALGAVDLSAWRAGANSVRWGGATSATTTSRTEINKAVSAIADNTATATFTVTVPNAAHSAMLKVTLVGSLGAGGAVGANEATGTVSYDFAITRTAGLDTVVGASSAYGSSTAAVAGAATITVTAAASVMTGASSAQQTFTINVTIARGSGTSTNHTCLCYGRLLNANVTGVTIA